MGGHGLFPGTGRTLTLSGCEISSPGVFLGSCGGVIGSLLGMHPTERFLLQSMRLKRQGWRQKNMDLQLNWPRMRTFLIPGFRRLCGRFRPWDGQTQKRMWIVIIQEMCLLPALILYFFGWHE